MASDASAKRCMKAAAAGGKKGALKEWNRQVVTQSWKQVVRKPALQQGIRLVKTAKLPSGGTMANAVGRTSASSWAGREVGKRDDKEYVHDRVHAGAVCGPICPAEGGRRALPSAWLTHGCLVVAIDTGM